MTKEKEETYPVQVTVPVSAVTHLERIAEVQNRSLSGLVRVIVLQWLKERECAHPLCIRNGMKDDIHELTCLECGQSLTLTTDEIRRRGIEVAKPKRRARR